jgi:hypothetical protein
MGPAWECGTFRRLGGTQTLLAPIRNKRKENNLRRKSLYILGYYIFFIIKKKRIVIDTNSIFNGCYFVVFPR